MNTKREWFIYTLNDPRDDEVRYVGWTTRPTKRLKEHIRSANKEKNYKAHWITSLLVSGLNPVIRVIEQGTGKWAEVEQYWIAYYRSIGARLTNLTDGGEGVVGWKMPDHVIDARKRAGKLARKIKRNTDGSYTYQKKSPEYIANLQASRRGKKQTPEQIEKAKLTRIGKKRSPDLKRKKWDADRKSTWKMPDHVKDILAKASSKRTMCIETGIIYPSLTAACEFAGGHKANMSHAVLNGKKFKGFYWRYLENDSNETGAE